MNKKAIVRIEQLTIEDSVNLPNYLVEFCVYAWLITANRQ